MNWKNIGLIVFIAIVLIIPVKTVFGLTVIRGGEVTGQWTLQGTPYLVNASISIPVNGTLIIDPGVEVLFTSGTQFDVFGALIAEGTPEDSIIFRANSGAIGDWRWLKTTGVRASDSRLSYCIIRHSEYGLHIIGCQPIVTNCRLSEHSRSCLLIEGGSRVEVSHSLISSSRNQGIKIDEGSSPRIRDCRVQANANVGIAVTGNSTPKIERVVFTQAIDHAISLQEAGACSLKSNEFYDSNLRAININQSNRVVLFRNIIYRSGGDYAIYAYRCGEVKIVNNTIYENGITGLGVVNCTASEVTGNVVMMSGQDGIYNQGGGVSISYNDVLSNGRNDYGGGIQAGMGDISENPLFVNPGIHDFTPTEGSPVINAGNPRVRDPDGTISDIGAVFYNLNARPEIHSYWPENLDRAEGDLPIEFGITASDAEGQRLTYKWWVNGELQGGAGDSTFTYTFRRDGQYSVFVIADDRLYMGQVIQEWQFEVYGSSAPFDRMTSPADFSLGAPYPNPFNETTRFQIDISSPGAVKIILQDLTGRIVYESDQVLDTPGVHDFAVSSANIPAGMFILSAEKNGIRFNKRLVVLK